MKKIAVVMILVLLICVVVTGGQLMKDKYILRNNVIRLHVVANSDSREDQSVKLFVKDAIVAYLRTHMVDVHTTQQAKKFIADNISQLTTITNEKLKEEKCDYSAEITLQAETFGKRDYDTFSLPSGIYESLRVKIGNADGKNWWCVIYPSLCIPSSVDAFQDVAVSAGFDSDLTGTLSRNGAYEIRFYILDWLGKLENFFLFQ